MNPPVSASALSCARERTDRVVGVPQLSCAWRQVPWLQTALSSAHSSPSSLIQNRNNILRAVTQLQVHRDIPGGGFTQVSEQNLHQLLFTQFHHILPHCTSFLSSPLFSHPLLSLSFLSPFSSSPPSHIYPLSSLLCSPSSGAVIPGYYGSGSGVL